jgi:hypothetical protein
MELLEQLEPLEPWIEPRKSNGKFFPTIADDSKGFEASFQQSSRTTQPQEFVRRLPVSNQE